jgi:hypothetical protein
MTFSLADLDRSAAPLRAFEGADLAGLASAQLLSLQRLAAAGANAWDVVQATIAGEVARRSRVEDGPNSLARQQGFAGPEQLVASIVGGPRGDGARLVATGRVLEADAGSPECERRPAVAAGIRSGALTLAKAELIVRTLEPLPGDTTELEARLVRMGKRLDYARLRRACRTEAARFDALELEGRERRQAQARTFDWSEDVSGMTHLSGDLDPVSAAFVNTYFDAQVKAAFQARNDGHEDPRTAGQIRADALVALVMHGLDCECKASGVKATVVVRIDKDQLEQEVGVATCDAIATPISLKALRQIAVDASILPIVMNGRSEVLDMGREERLFNWRQRMALAERDGGCAKCHAPISHCITHHIRWWSRDGRTDLRNGVLLCTRCHTQVHHDQWDIEIDPQNRVWFVTPRHLDPDRSRILGGLAALADA